MKTGMLPHLKIKPPEPWMMGKTKEGSSILLPPRMRIKPNKYAPKAGPMPKNSPHCLDSGRKDMQIIKCRSCMWQGQCGKEVKGVK